MMCAMEVEARSPVRFARVDGRGDRVPDLGDRSRSGVVVVPPLAQNIELTWERPGVPGDVRPARRLRRGAALRQARDRGLGPHRAHAHHRRAGRGPRGGHGRRRVRAGPRARHLRGRPGGRSPSPPPTPSGWRPSAMFGSGARIVGDLTDGGAGGAPSGWCGFFHERWGTDESVTLAVVRTVGGRGPGLRAPGSPATSASRRRPRDRRGAGAGRGGRRPVPARRPSRVPTLLLHRSRRRDRVHRAGAGDRSAAAGRPPRRARRGRPLRPRSATSTPGWTTTSGSWPAPSPGSRRRRRCAGGPHRHHGRVPGDGGRGGRADQRLGLTPGPGGLSSGWPSRPAGPCLGTSSPSCCGPTSGIRPAAAPASRSCCRTSGGCWAAGWWPTATRSGSTSAAVQLDLVALHDAIARGDDDAVVALHRGPVLPEDAYDDWATGARERFASATASARRRLAATAAEGGRWDEVVDHARAMLAVDEFDERAHELLVRGAGGRRPSG